MAGTVICAIVAVIDQRVHPESTAVALVGKHVIAVITWAILRKWAKNYATFAVFAAIAFDHTLFVLSFLSKAEWYIPNERLMLHQDQIYFNLVFALLFNYNSFLVSLIAVPTLFFIPYVFYCVWASSFYDDQHEFEGPHLYERISQFALILVAYLAHNYFVQKDFALANIEKIMASRQQGLFNEFIEASEDATVFLDADKKVIFANSSAKKLFTVDLNA